MTTLAATQARKQLYGLLDSVAASHEPVQIAGKRNSAVLIAEDDPASRELLKRVLNVMKITDVTLVEDGLSAWQEIEKADRDFDLVISDWNMPIASGLELLEQMREEGLNTPFLMTTGRGLMESAIEAKESGAEAFVAKPYSTAHIMQKIKELLNM